MIPKEILKKVRRIEIITNRLVNEMMAGEYHSVFKGRGIEFEEVRDYQLGDDVRTIDWNVTARMGRPYVKQYVEERELTVVIVVDASSSSEFGSTERLKMELAAEIAAVLAFSAIKNNDRVGLLIFTDRVEKFIPPKKGRNHVLRVIREILHFQPERQQTNIPIALDYLNRVLKRKSVVFLISDFLAEDFKKPLSIANKRHDLISVIITDPRELEMTSVGFIELEDAETGEIIMIDTSNLRFRRRFSALAQEQKSRVINLFNTLGVDYIDVRADKSYIQPMVRLFRQRAKRY